ncbi:CBS domain-containing protein [Streptomyces sp. Midd1]|uniref:CBS domain-containing protein n=1 Tax=Streptomyces sp. Midd3 TaxID=3161191 RepID=UPI0034DB065E
MERNPYRMGDVMTHAVVAVGRKALFEDILERMEKWQVSGLPVLEGDGRVIGPVSEAELLSKEVFRGRDAVRTTRLRSVPEPAKAEAVTRLPSRDTFRLRGRPVHVMSRAGHEEGPDRPCVQRPLP